MDRLTMPHTRLCVNLLLLSSLLLLFWCFFFVCFFFGGGGVWVNSQYKIRKKGTDCNSFTFLKIIYMMNWINSYPCRGEVQLYHAIKKQSVALKLHGMKLKRLKNKWRIGAIHVTSWSIAKTMKIFI